MYRVQSVISYDDGLNTKNLPVKRVLLSGGGQLIFNPNSDKYIYFSRSAGHHIYYLYSRVFKIVKEELRWAKNNDAYRKLNLPDDFRAFTFRTNVNVDMIKDVQNFFKNYLPEKSIESIELDYMAGFGKMLEECSVYNVKKKLKMNCPEVSDPHVVGGAYGINDAWLDLLDSCTYQSRSVNITFDYVFDFLRDTAYKGKVSRQVLKYVLEDNPYLADVTKGVVYATIANPKFFDKNNVNRIISNLEVIEENALYNPDRRCANEEYFDAKKRELKEEFRSARKELVEQEKE